MPDTNVQGAATSGPQAAHHEWVKDFTGKDPRSYEDDVIPVEAVEVKPPPAPYDAMNPAPKLDGLVAAGNKQAATNAMGAPSSNLPASNSNPTNYARTPPKPAAPAPIIPYNAATLNDKAPEKPTADPATSALAPPTTKSALANRVDLEGRLANAQPIYDQMGTKIGDDSQTLANRLSPAEQKIGRQVTETGSKMTTIKADGTTNVVDTSVNGGDTRGVLDEKGYTRTTKKGQTEGFIGADGKAAETTTEHTESRNVGLTNTTKTVADKKIDSAEGVTTTKASSQATTYDLLKGERMKIDSKSTEIKRDGVTYKDGETNTQTVGASGYNSTREVSEQTGKNFNSTATSHGLKRGSGEAGYGFSRTKKSGEKTGSEETEITTRSQETGVKANAGLVSNKDGTGLGAGAGTTAKKNFENGASLNGTFSAGGKLQSIVKQVPGKEPPQFKITTTISFDLSAGGGGGYETAKAKPLDASKGADATVGAADTQKKTGSVGLSASVGKSAAFSHVMNEKEATDYVEAIKNNGQGSKLPEFSILKSGMKDGWDKAAQMWAELSGKGDTILDMGEGSEIERTTRGSVGVSAGIGGGERAPTGTSVGADVSVSTAGSVTMKLAKQKDGIVKVTCSIDRKDNLSVGVTGGTQGLTAGHREGRGQSVGEDVVFMLDGKDRKIFDAQLKEIDGCYTREALVALSTKPGFVVAETTKRDGRSESDENSVGAAGLSLGLTGEAALDASTTRDGQGNVTGAKVSASNKVGGSFGTADVRLSYNEGETLNAETKDGASKMELGQTTEQSDKDATVKNLAQAKNDIMGTMLNPGKMVGTKTKGKSMDLDDDEIIALASHALDIPKWKGMPVGNQRTEAWLQCGAAIRASITVEDGVVTGFDRPTINRALAEWTAGKDGARVSILRRLLRPAGASGAGAPAGKEFTFPPGTETVKAYWDPLMYDNPLKPLKAMLRKDPAAALKDLTPLAAKFAELMATLRDLEPAWSEAKPQYAEMTSHLAKRAQQCDQLVLDAKHAQRDAKEDAKPGSAGIKAVMKQFHDDEDQDDQDKQDLKVFEKNMHQLKGYFDVVFETLNKAEAKKKERGLFSGAGGDETLAANEMVESAKERLALWKDLYGETYQLWDKLHASHDLDKKAMEALHPHGAEQFYAKVYQEIRV